MDQQDRPVSFALIGDTQYADCDDWGSRNYRGGMTKLVAILQTLNERDDLDFIVSLGDMGDGRAKEEIPALIQQYRKSKVPVKYVAGNHDFCQRSHEQLLDVLGLEDFFYEFSVRNVRFIFYDSMDESGFSSHESGRYERAMKYREAHAERNLTRWNGMLSQSSKDWLRNRIEDAEACGQDAVIISHAPMNSNAAVEEIMWDGEELMKILEGYHCVRACFAGHYHAGGLNVRNGIVHKTVKAMCNCKIPTCTIAHVYADRLELEGIGEEFTTVHPRMEI